MEENRAGEWTREKVFDGRTCCVRRLCSFHRHSFFSDYYILHGSWCSLRSINGIWTILMVPPHLLTCNSRTPSRKQLVSLFVQIVGLVLFAMPWHGTRKNFQIAQKRGPPRGTLLPTLLMLTMLYRVLFSAGARPTRTGFVLGIFWILRYVQFMCIFFRRNVWMNPSIRSSLQAKTGLTT